MSILTQRIKAGYWLATHTETGIHATHPKREQAISDCQQKAEGSLPLPPFLYLRYYPGSKLFRCFLRQHPFIFSEERDHDAAILSCLKKAYQSGTISHSLASQYLNLSAVAGSKSS